MPVLGYFNNMWYGSASGAMVVDEPVIEVSASAKMNARLTASIEGGVIEPYLKMTRALKQTLIVEAGGGVEKALPKSKMRGACSVSIGAVPSAFDITQSVLNALTSNYTLIGSVGEALGKLSSISGAPTKEEIRQEIDNNSTRLSAIQADLDNPDQYKADISTLATAEQLLLTEGNIRGDDGDTLKIISGKVQSVDTKTTEIHKIQGLELGTPMTVTPTSRVAGDIELGLEGDGENYTTVTRQ